MISSLLRSIFSSVGPCLQDYTILLPDFSQQSVSSLKKLSSLDWTDFELWNKEDVELFQLLGIDLTIGTMEYEESNSDIIMDEIIEPDPYPMTENKLLPKRKDMKRAVERALKRNTKRLDKRRRDHSEEKGETHQSSSSRDFGSDNISLKKRRVTLKSPSRLSENFNHQTIPEAPQDKTRTCNRNVKSRPSVLVENHLDVGEEEKMIEAKGEEMSNYVNPTKRKENVKDETIFVSESNVRLEGPELIQQQADTDNFSENDLDQIQRTLLQQQEFSDDEETEEDEDTLDFSALYKARDNLRRELGLSDDEDA